MKLGCTLVIYVVVYKITKLNSFNDNLKQNTDTKRRFGRIIDSLSSVRSIF